MAVRLISATVYAKDRDATLRFYRDALGMQPEREESSWGYVELRGWGGLQLIPSQAGLAYSAAAKPGDVMLTFLVDEIAKTYARLLEAGAKSIQAPEPDHGTQIAHLRDPDGRLITLVQDRWKLLPPLGASDLF
jgi:catechol 2,3-dioxygenase-like lactoylglutathione lyase family enzyme